MSYRPEKVYVEKDAARFAQTAAILARLGRVPVEEIEDCDGLVHALRQRPDPVGEGKRFLLLRRDKGRSFKPFPETAQYLSCDYFTLHVAEGCDLECSYCILQAYLTNPLLTVYVNVEEMLENLDRFLRANADRFFRIGTGQLADSLSLDPITRLTAELVPFFARRENAVLELKTKSARVEGLLALEPRGRTIVSWSVNSEKIQKEEEHKCASLEERLGAAEKAVRAGYRVGFHFDPVIDYPGWEKDYAEVAERIFARIEPGRIAWISLGCLRFMPGLKPIMQKRFPRSPLALGEWITGLDGKMRYLKARRVEIYRALARRLRQRAPQVTVYLSMETPEVWRLVFGRDFSKETVCALLDAAAKRF